LLGGIAYYAQKGFTFKWSADQDYYAGCVVIDDTDGLRYECIADVTANSTAPSADATHWQIFKAGTDIDAWFRQASTVYAVGDMRCSESLPYGWYLDCTTAGTTGSGDITIPSPLNVGDTVTDGAVVWTIRKISSSDGVPLGAIIAYSANGELPSGYLLCDGSAVSRTMFPDLFSAIGTTYGAGDGSTTFNVPDYNTAERFAQGSTVAGTVKTAGLPNITGGPSGIQGTSGAGFQVGPRAGAFYVEGSVNYNPVVQSTTYTGRLNFDASLSNPIYGNSTTVQPPALTTRYIIKAFDGQTADSALIDITQYANELAHKADQVNTAGAHNSIWRGKDLTSYFDSGEMSADIAAENWKNIYVGDYITKTVTIDGTTYEDVKWIVMHINYHLHEGDTETTQNHVVLMPEERLGTIQMNSSNTTSGGYTGSAMWTAHIPKVVTGIEAAFGADHVLEHRELLTNAMDANQKSSAYYGWNGASSNWLWVSVKVNLANEAMVYGAPTVSSSFFDTGECNTQLAAFKLNHGLICSKRYWWWLRSIAHSPNFCAVDVDGNAANYGASASSAGVRPYFLLY
jgi:hypothetical protein